MSKKTFIFNNCVEKKESKAPGVITFVLSTIDVDRDSEVLIPKGVNIKEFKRNPILLWNHDSYSRPSIGKILMETFDVFDEKIVSDVLFDLNDPFAKLIHDKYLNGFLNSGSVRFMPTKIGEPIFDDQKGVTYEKWDLLEFSAVNIPANPNANAVMRQLHEEAENVKGDAEMYEAYQAFTKSVKDAYEKADVDIDDAKYPVHKNVKDYIEQLKAGRVLSKTNEKKLRDAHASIGAVLSAVADDESDDDKTIELPDNQYLKSHPEFEGNFNHHVLIDGELKADWSKVADAMIELVKGNTSKIKKENLKSIYDHLVNHYKEFDKEPPELQYESGTAQSGQNNELIKGLNESINKTNEIIEKFKENLNDT